MHILKAVVRIEEGKPLIFTDSPDVNPGMVESFGWHCGHNEACREYMRRLPLADDATANQQIASYQRYVNSLPDCADIVVQKAKRIRR